MDRTLSRGMTGDDVADLQAALNYHLRPPQPPHTQDGPPRPPLEIDGIFGPLTEKRLIEFQQVNDLADDGVVGRETRPVLFTARQLTVKIPINKPDVPSFLRPTNPPQAPAWQFDHRGIRPRQAELLSAARNVSARSSLRR